MRETRRAERFLELAGQRVVLAEHHPARQRALRGRQATAQRLLGPAADRVHDARDATAPRAGLPHRVGAQRRVGTSGLRREIRR